MIQSNALDRVVYHLNLIDKEGDEFGLHFAGDVRTEDWRHKLGTKYAWCTVIHADGGNYPLLKGQIAVYACIKSGRLSVEAEARNLWAKGRAPAPPELIQRIAKACARIRARLEEEGLTHDEVVVAAIPETTAQRKQREAAEAAAKAEAEAQDFMDIFGGES
jgi:hypothetical protein